MFTGLVEELGILRYITRRTGSAQLSINASRVISDLNPGDSIAVNGVCLTVTELGKDFFTADVMLETLVKTNLGQLKPGERVNLERALRLGDRLGGHLVSGHIDGVGTISRKEQHDIAVLITVTAPPEVLRYIIKKGSIAVDGISLTVVDFNHNSFRISLIPHTARVTTLGFKNPGDTVNLEVDIVGKYIERLLANHENPGVEKGVSLSFLTEHGFI